MVSLKKTALAVVALGVSGVASAAMYTPAPVACNADSVTVPCEKSAWDLGLQALYVETNSIGSVAHAAVTTGSDIATTYNELDPEGDWGYRLELSYHFGTGNDINVNWTHIEADSDSHLTSLADDINNLTGLTPSADVKTHLEDEFDAVNFEFGQHVDFGEHYNARIHGGLQYMSVERELTQRSAALAPANVGDNNTLVAKSDFDGFGPRAGLDTSYDFGNGFAIYGNAAVSLLAGDDDYTAANTATVGTTATVTTAIYSESKIVAGAEGTVGVAYTHPMAQGDLTFNLGYQVVNYWEPSTGFAAATAVPGGDSNFGYHGVTFGAKWVGNVA